MQRRREVCGIVIGTTELTEKNPAVYIDINGRAKVYFTAREAMEFSEQLQEEAYAALGYGAFGRGTA